MKTKYLQLEFLGDYSKYILPVFGAKNKKAGVFGTAFLISPHFAVTAHHVFHEYLKFFNLSGSSHADFEMKLLRIENPERYIEYDRLEAANNFLLVKSVTRVGNSDLALLEIDGDNNSYLRLNFQPPYVGKKVYSMGYPKSIVDHVRRDGGTFEIGINPRLSEGYVVSCTPHRHSGWRPFPIFETLMELEGGMSGSPVFDDSLSVIGMAMSSLNTSDSQGNYSSFFALLAPLLGININYGGEEVSLGEYLKRIGAHPESVSVFDVNLVAEEYVYKGEIIDWFNK